MNTTKGGQKINVILYGGKSPLVGKEVPLSADVTYCDAADECPLRKQGKCLLATRIGLDLCPHGIIKRYKGYTSRAQKYKAFRSKYEEDQLYNALEEPQDRVVIFAIGDEVFLKLGAIGLEYNTEINYRRMSYTRANQKGMFICDPWLGSKSMWVPRDAADADFFEKACGYIPRAFFGYNEIKDYQQKNVPMIVHLLRDVLPDVYQELIQRHPELTERELDHTGRYARTITLRDGAEIRDCHGNVFVKQGNQVACESYDNILVGIDGVEALGTATVTIPINESSYTKVEDNRWVTDETDFK